MPLRRMKLADGGSFAWAGASREAAHKEYELFRGCIAQLLDPESMVGDVDQRWVIFHGGWVYGMASYATEEDARVFGKQMFRDDPNATYVVVKVDVTAHGLNAMEVLASAVSDGPGIDISTTPDERNRKQGEES